MQRFLWVMLIALCGIGSPAKAAGLCGGEAFPITTARGGHAPYIRLSLGGRTGNFLFDVGATDSAVDAVAWPSTGDTVTANGFTLPSFDGGTFRRTQSGADLADGSRSIGMVGTDFSSMMTSEFDYTGAQPTLILSADPCPSVLVRNGFVPINQDGFFGPGNVKVDRSKGVANVPVVFLQVAGVRVWAQIDSGYDDTYLHHSIDINRALYARLVRNGAPLKPVPGGVHVGTCDGAQDRPVFTLPGQYLVVTDEDGKPIRRIAQYYLIVKDKNGCGGIADTDAPAAQLGASFLRSFGVTIIDANYQTLWIRPD